MAADDAHHKLSMDDVLRSLQELNESTGSGHAGSSDEEEQQTQDLPCSPSPTPTAPPSSASSSFDDWITYLSLQTSSPSKAKQPFATDSSPSSFDFDEAVDRLILDKGNTSDTHVTPPPSPTSLASSFDRILDQYFTPSSGHLRNDDDGDAKDGDDGQASSPAPMWSNGRPPKRKEQSGSKLESDAGHSKMPSRRPRGRPPKKRKTSQRTAIVDEVEDGRERYPKKKNVSRLPVIAQVEQEVNKPIESTKSHGGKEPLQHGGTAQSGVKKRGRGRPPKRKITRRPSAAVSMVGQGPVKEISTIEDVSIIRHNKVPWEQGSLAASPSDVDVDIAPAVSPPPLIPISRQDMGAIRLSSAALWHTAYMELPTLADRQWLDSVVCDFYLSSIWHDGPSEPLCRYIMIFRLRPDLQLSAAEIETYRHENQVPTEEPCSMIPVAFLVHDPASAHYFPVVFDYEARTAYVFGRKISNNDPEYDASWDAWKGPERWETIADLHHWAPGDADTVLVLIRDWRQNGYDCGPIACALIKMCMEDGLEETWRTFSDCSLMTPAPIPCGHILRLNMLGAVQQRCMTSFRDYMHFLTDMPPHWNHLELDDVTILQMQSGGDQERDRRLLRSLTLASNLCRDCQRDIINISRQNSRRNMEEDDCETDGGAGIDLDQEDGQGREEDTTDPAKALFALIKSHRILRGARLCRAHLPAHAVGARAQAMKKNDEETGMEEGGHDEEQLSNAARTSRRQVKDWRLGIAQRFPRMSRPVSLSAYKGQRFLPHDHDYDDYDDGPTLEMLQRPDVYSILTHPFKNMVLAPAWIMWRDHGYRILTNSFQMFYLAPPIAIMDHVMTIGKMDGERNLDNAEEDDEVEAMSAMEMLQYSGDSPRIHEWCTNGHNMFVRGRLPVFSEEDKYVRVDLEQDKIDVSEEDMEISIDIDSIIWTTRKLVCTNSIGVYLTPLYDGKPGILKHNHVYVDILVPQSETDQLALGRRKEWISKKFPLNAIPHAIIGQLSSSTGHGLRVYIFFPRMIHRSPLTGRRMNMMPKDVLDPFWEEVFLPAIAEQAEESWAPYMSQTLEEGRYKQKGASHGRRTLPLSNQAFLDIQYNMKQLISEEEDRSMYGSFFFAVEGKGIKLLTKDGQGGEYVSPEVALRHNLSCLNWDYMLDRRNGELLVDVGISFTPKTTDPLVGLWRLDALEESYVAAGFNKGTIHHHCMLHRYGALQAEMPEDRALQTHIAFRNTYNLYYEAVRPNNNIPSFAKDSDAYNLTPAYHRECFGTIKALRGAKAKTYGVRDEYRVSGQAAQVLLRDVLSHAKRYMESEPVLWLPSEVWFDFLSRRMEEIQRTQIRLKQLNPPNLGTLTGILNHMLRCTIYTPIVYDFHARESLALLEYRNVLRKVEMFFLHDLDARFQPCLDSIQESDDFRVLALMGLNAKAQRDKALASQRPTILDGFDQTARFPIGPNPTWGQLKKAIAANPMLMLKEWMMPPRLQNRSVILARLFCRFTEQLWLMVDDKSLKGIAPSPVSLSDAMKCWTISSVDQTLLHTTFEACNTGLEVEDGVVHGRQGPRSMSFASRKEIYFPAPGEKTLKKGSQWLPFLDDVGYIRLYHEVLEERNDEERLLVEDALETIFAHLHCLPASQKGTPKTKGFVWKVKDHSFVFYTNPTFYKVEGLSKESRMERKPGERRVSHVLKSRKVFEEVLWRSSGLDGLASKNVETERQLRRARLQRLSTATKNKRRPPQRKKRVKIVELRELTPEEDDEFDSPLMHWIQGPGRSAEKEGESCDESEDDDS